MAGGGFFGNPDGIERLAHALAGPDGRSGGVAQAIREVRVHVSQTVDSLVPADWTGKAADAFAQTLKDRDVRDLANLSDAAVGLGVLLFSLAAELSVANRQAERARQTAHDAGFGFDIDSSGDTSGDWLHRIEQQIPGLVNADLLKTAHAEMLAARRRAEQAWDAARHLLGNVRVPRIGSDTVHQAERWGFDHAALPANIQGRHTTESKLPPTTRRPKQYADQQRQDGISFVHTHCASIVQAAKHYGVPAEAIAGAILWEAVEDPHSSRREAAVALGPGPGKVHWVEGPGTPNAAEQAENDGKIPPPLPGVIAGLADLGPGAGALSALIRRFRVLDPDSAIQYIGAILSDDVEIYKKIAHVDISQNIGVLLTLYEEGYAEDKARERAANPSQPPQIGADMGPWVMEHLPWVRAQLPCL
jgi:hypothetical protein